MGKIHKACQGYKEWKIKNSPAMKPWRRPEQSSLRMLDVIDIGTMKETSTAELIDEREIEQYLSTTVNKHSGGAST